MNNSAPVHLRGITWKHTRGLLPVLATAQRFEELHPQVHISWDTRSLQEFADESLDALAQRYDLLVIDHPSCGIASSRRLLLPLDEALPEPFLRDQATNSVGQSYPSYLYDGHLWALPIDAAAPVSLCRTDLLRKSGNIAPRDWEDLIRLAREGLVVVPGLAIDSLMHFYMLCLALGEEPFAVEGRVVTAEVGKEAMRMLRELLQLCPRECLDANPIAIWNLLSSSSRAAYCPFAYGYSNFSRQGYADRLVEAGEIVSFRGRPLRSVLGGAGLAISASCSNAAEAAAYSQYASSAHCQRTLYFDAGGQPGHRAAWLDPEVNRRSHGYFEQTLPVLDRAWVRPRFDGYLEFQSEAGELLHQYLCRGGDEEAVMTAMNGLLLRTGATRESKAL